MSDLDKQLPAQPCGIVYHFLPARLATIRRPSPEVDTQCLELRVVLFYKSGPEMADGAVGVLVDGRIQRPLAVGCWNGQLNIA